MPTSVKFPATITGSFWLDTANAVSDNGLYASYLGGVSVWDEIVATNFSFAIPGDSTVDGFSPQIERHYEIGTVIDNSLKLVKASVAVGNDLDSGAAWPASDEVATYGGAAEKGGQTWTPADVNASGCGFRLVAEGTGTDAEGYIDYMKMTVYYTEAAPAVTVRIMIFCLNALSMARAGLALCSGNREQAGGLISLCRARLNRKKSQTRYGKAQFTVR